MDNSYPYWMNLLLALDQLLNAALGGSCDETLSSRTYRMARVRGGGWARFERLVDTLFWRDVDEKGRRHCELSYLVEVSRGHMPRKML